MLFDTHAHYDDRRFDADRDALLSGMPDAGIGLLLNPGCDMKSSEFAVSLSKRYAHMYAAVGVHPHDAANMTDADLDALGRMAVSAKVMAIGEIGLDYHYDYSPRDVQRARFRDQMELAGTLGLPVIIHDRDAHEDCLNIIREYPGVRGVFHCYSGSAEYAKSILKLGYMLSFTGTVTYKNARNAVETVRMCPRDMLMIETDAPYLTPEPHRGERNDSRFVGLVCERIAEIWGVTKEEAAEITTRNGKRFFGIE